MRCISSFVTSQRRFSVAERKAFASDVLFMKEKSLVKKSLSEALLSLYLRERRLVIIGAFRSSPGWLLMEGISSRFVLPKKDRCDVDLLLNRP